MKKPLTFAGILMLGFVLVRCSVGKQCTDTLAQGTYRYSHGWEYQYGGNWVAVKEEGTMAFHPDGTALDSALQHYRIETPEGTVCKIDYLYQSPSWWHIEDSNFFFRGVAETFVMQPVSMESSNPALCDSLSQVFIDLVTRGIARETCFHLKKLNRRQLVWTLRYPDGHTDSWQFYRTGKLK